MIEWSLNEFDEVDSTQSILRNLGASGAKEGAVVTARHQTAGRGRHGREWVSPVGGLYMSLLLRPSSSAMLQTLTLAASLAVVRGVDAVTSLKARIRWPNDVMIGDKKLAGVIAESSFTGGVLSFVIIGIGVNCNSDVSLVNSSNPATSLSSELGRDTDIERLRQAILDAFAPVYDEWLKGTDVVRLVRNVVRTLGRRVIVIPKAGKAIEGVALDIDQAGGLMVKQGDEKLTLQAEDVERLRET